jgi:hypothetical protein
MVSTSRVADIVVFFMIEHDHKAKYVHDGVGSSWRLHLVMLLALALPSVVVIIVFGVPRRMMRRGPQNAG